MLGAGMGVASAAYADIPGVPNPTTAPTIAPTPDDQLRLRPAIQLRPGNQLPAPGNPAPQNGAPAWPMTPEQEEVLVKTLSEHARRRRGRGQGGSRPGPRGLCGKRAGRSGPVAG